MKNIPGLIEYLKWDKQRTSANKLARMFAVSLGTVINREGGLGFARRGEGAGAGRPRLKMPKNGYEIIALRKSGMAWSKIGETIGVSKQCAQQVFLRATKGYWQVSKELRRSKQ